MSTPQDDPARPAASSDEPALATSPAVPASANSNAIEPPSAFGARAKDHRGKWCRLRPRVGPGEEPPIAERGPVDWSFTLPAIGCLAIFAFAACGAGTMAFLALSTITKGAPIWIPLSIAALGSLSYVAWAFHRRHRNKVALLADAHIRLWLAKDRCPSCGYSLTEITASPDDGRTVCPECGAAWRKSLIPADHS